MASRPPPAIETFPTNNLYFNPYSGFMQTIVFTVKNAGAQPIDYRISSTATTISFAPKEGSISGKNEIKIEVTASTEFAAQRPAIFTIEWINSFNLNKKNNFTISTFRGTKNINILFNAENRFILNGPFTSQQTLYTRIRNPLHNNVAMRVLSTDTKKIRIWPDNAIIPAGGFMDIGINFEAISKFRKERILVKIINLPNNFLDLTIPQMFVDAPFYYNKNYPIIFNH